MRIVRWLGGFDDAIFARTTAPQLRARTLHRGGPRTLQAGGFVVVTSIGELEAAYAEATPEQQAGFVAALVTLAPPGTPVRPEWQSALEHFARLAKLDPTAPVQARQRQVDAFFEKYPLSPRLMSALGSQLRSRTLNKELARDRRAAAAWLGAGAPQTAPALGTATSRATAVRGLLSLRAGQARSNRNPQTLEKRKPS
jgi:hypothetical protein